jgi:hypothetical protein
MPRGPERLYKVGGISFVLSGLLFLSKAVLDLMVGPPPSGGAEVLAWAASNQVLLAWTNEVMFFAVILLVPAVAALYLSLAGVDGPKAVAGCGVMAVAIPVMAVLDIVHGRLVYPVYGMRVSSPATAELVVTLFHGGMHAVWIMLGVATFVLGLAMRRSPYGRTLAYLGLATGVFDVVGSYPWLLGTPLVVASQLSFTAWFVAVGWKLHRLASSVAPGSSTAVELT